MSKSNRKTKRNFVKKIFNAFKKLYISHQKTNSNVTRQEGVTESALLMAAAGHYVAAEMILESGFPFTYNSGGYLLQLAIELVIKAVCLYENNEFKPIHNLQDLTKCVKGLQLEDNDTILIRELDMMYGLRYPIFRNKCKKTKALEGGYRYSGEVGGDDLYKGKIIIEKILLHLPEELSIKYNNYLEGTRIELP